MSGTDEEDANEVVNISVQEGDTRDLQTTEELIPNETSQIVVLYVVGIFLAIVLLIAMGYILKLYYKAWLPKRKHLCDFRDCFRQSNGKKRKNDQRNSHSKTNFTIPVVVIVDENGQSMDLDCLDSEETETKFNEKFP